MVLPSPHYGTRARRNDPDTSHQAAASVSIKTIRKTHNFIVRVLYNIIEATDEEMWLLYERRHKEEFKTSQSGLRTRRSELQKAGWVESAGQQKNKNNRLVNLWTLTNRAHAAYQGIELEGDIHKYLAEWHNVRPF